MNDARCPRCETSVDAGDNYCRDCGWSLRLPSSGSRAMITGVSVEKLKDDRPTILPALRSDLAPLLPTLRRTATVLAAAAVTDWAIRIGTRALLQEGMSRLSLRGRPRAPGNGRALTRNGNTAGDADGMHTVVVEQRVTLRRS